MLSIKKFYVFLLFLLLVARKDEEESHHLNEMKNLILFEF